MLHHGSLLSHLPVAQAQQRRSIDVRVVNQSQKVLSELGWLRRHLPLDSAPEIDKACITVVQQKHG